MYLGIAKRVGPVEGAGLRCGTPPDHGVHRGVPGNVQAQVLVPREVRLAITFKDIFYLKADINGVKKHPME